MGYGHLVKQWQAYNKKKYYEALNAFDKNLIIDDLYEFLKQESVKTWLENEIKNVQRRRL